MSGPIRSRPEYGDRRLPKDIRNIILGSRSDIESKDSVGIVNELYNKNIHKPDLWKKVAQKWHFKVNERKKVEGQVIREITRVTNLAIECVTDPDFKEA